MNNEYTSLQTKHYSQSRVPSNYTTVLTTICEKTYHGHEIPTKGLYAFLVEI